MLPVLIWAALFLLVGLVVYRCLGSLWSGAPLAWEGGRSFPKRKGASANFEPPNTIGGSLVSQLGPFAKQNSIKAPRMEYDPGGFAICQGRLLEGPLSWERLPDIIYRI